MPYRLVELRYARRDIFFLWCKPECNWGSGKFQVILQGLGCLSIVYRDFHCGCHRFTSSVLRMKDSVVRPYDGNYLNIVTDLSVKRYVRLSFLLPASPKNRLDMDIRIKKGKRWFAFPFHNPRYCPGITTTSYNDPPCPKWRVYSILVGLSVIPGFTKRYRIYYGFLFLNTDDLHRAEI